MKYTKAIPSTLAIVRRIAEANHRRLDGANIAVVMREKAAKKAGKTVMASAGKPSARLKPLLDANYSFVITIAEDEWSHLTAAKRDALIDHELCHCEFDENDEPSLRAHDMEEFAEIIERHGFWREDYGEKIVQEALLSQGVEVGTIK